MNFKFEISYQKGGASYNPSVKSIDLKKKLKDMELDIKKLEKSIDFARIKIDDETSQFHNRPGYLITLLSGEKKIALFKIYYFKKLNENDNEYRVPVGPELPGNAYHVFDANKYRYKIISNIDFVQRQSGYLLTTEPILGDMPENTVFVKSEIRKCQNYLRSDENPKFHYANNEIEVQSEVILLGFWSAGLKLLPETVKAFFTLLRFRVAKPENFILKESLNFNNIFIKVKNDDDYFGTPNVTVQSNFNLDDSELLRLLEDNGADESKESN